MNLPPLGRKINERLCPLSRFPWGKGRGGRETPTPPKAGGSPYKRVFKAPC